MTFNLPFRCQSVDLWVRQIVEELAGGEVQEAVLGASITLRLQANTSLGQLLVTHKKEITGEMIHHRRSLDFKFFPPFFEGFKVTDLTSRISCFETHIVNVVKE